MPLVVDLLKKYKLIAITTMITAVVVFIIVLTYAHFKETKTYNRAASQLVELSKNVAKAYQTKPNYWGLSTAEVITNKLYASGMGIKNGKLIGYFDNEVEIGADENGSPVMPGGKNFVISYSGLNKKQCVGLASYKYDEKFWLSVAKISIKNSQTIQDFVWGDEQYGILPNKKILKNICNDYDNKLLVYF